jgi:hypothetical protein
MEGMTMNIISFSRFGKYSLIGTFLLFMFLFLMPAPQAAAETMKFRVVYFHTKVETVEVGDVEGHNLYSGESTGLATLETGEVAVTTLTWVADYIKGTGIVPVSYVRLTFEDGSTIDLKGELYTRPDPKGKGSIFERGTSEIYQGSGKYAGIKGKGTHSGKRLAPLGVKAQSYLDFIMTYTLP